MSPADASTKVVQLARDDHRSILSSFLLVAAAAVVLRAMGRSWWCACGGMLPWSWSVHTTHSSQHLFDPYSLTHVLHGVLFYFALSQLVPRLSVGRRFLIAVAVESAWEILENSPMIIDRYRAATISLNYYGDSIANSIADIVSCAMGFWIARGIGWRWSIALFVAVELLLLFMIRDCLTLNVIMLLYPIESIKQWQSEAAVSLVPSLEMRRVGFKPGIGVLPDLT
jgi:predicted MFS family arabinose efflux permease